MYSDDHRDTSAACVEFTFRVHSDGRRERLAVVLVRGEDGVYRPGPRRPTGDLARFVAKAIGEAMEELSPRWRPNRRHAIFDRRPNLARTAPAGRPSFPHSPGPSASGVCTIARPPTADVKQGDRPPA
ncbi:MAG: hypothetical protein ACLPZR_08325 [Solirubrobacteraceae bacterium]|jgi:hypothetical protein